MGYYNDVIKSLRGYCHDHSESCDWNRCPTNCGVDHSLNVETSMAWTSANLVEWAVKDNDLSLVQLRKMSFALRQFTNIALRHASSSGKLYIILSNAAECLRMVIKKY